MLALAVESGFALHRNRKFGPLYPPVVVDPISVLPGVNLARQKGAHWLFLRPHVGHIISWERAIQIHCLDSCYLASSIALDLVSTTTCSTRHRLVGVAAAAAVACGVPQFQLPQGTPGRAQQARDGRREAARGRACRARGPLWGGPSLGCPGAFSRRATHQPSHRSEEAKSLASLQFSLAITD